jgi:HSP20 family protein
MLMRFDPFREFDRMTQMFNMPAGGMRPPVMPMDAYREGDRLFVLFDIPGVDPHAIDLTVEKNVLSVRAERSWQPAEGQEVIITERPQGVFTRQLFLGENLDAEQMQAAYDKGVLTLTIPVAEQAKPRKVEVTGGNGNGGSQPIPTESIPTESIPTESIPTESIPTESTPTASVPSETVPTETVPAETVPTAAGTESSAGTA